MKATRSLARSLTSSSLSPLRQISHSSVPPRLQASFLSTTRSDYLFNSSRTIPPPQRRHIIRSLSTSPLPRQSNSSQDSTASSSSSTSSSSPPTTATSPTPLDLPSTPAIHQNTPAYQLTFTCRPCSVRSSHRISKQAYHFGASLIKCPGCGNRHIMSDHLGIFTDKGQGGTLEDILRRYTTTTGGGKGVVVDATRKAREGAGEAEGEEDIGTPVLKKGFVEGDLEFWDDGTVQRRKEAVEQARGSVMPGGDRIEPTQSVDLGNKKQ